MGSVQVVTGVIASRMCSPRGAVRFFLDFLWEEDHTSFFVWFVLFLPPHDGVSVERPLLAAALVFALAGTLIVTGHDVIGSLLILTAFIVVSMVMSRTPRAEIWTPPVTDFDDQIIASARRRAGEGRIE